MIVVWYRKPIIFRAEQHKRSGHSLPQSVTLLSLTISLPLSKCIPHQLWIPESVQIIATSYHRQRVEKVMLPPIMPENLALTSVSWHLMNEVSLLHLTQRVPSAQRHSPKSGWLGINNLTHSWHSSCPYSSPSQTKLRWWLCLLSQTKWNQSRGNLDSTSAFTPVPPLSFSAFLPVAIEELFMLLFKTKPAPRALDLTFHISLTTLLQQLCSSPLHPCAADS